MGLIKKTGDCAGARFYYAAVEEKFPGEAEKYNYEKLKIEKGDILQSLSGNGVKN